MVTAAQKISKSQITRIVYNVSHIKLVKLQSIWEIRLRPDLSFQIRQNPARVGLKKNKSGTALESSKIVSQQQIELQLDWPLYVKSLNVTPYKMSREQAARNYQVTVLRTQCHISAKIKLRNNDNNQLPMQSLCPQVCVRERTHWTATYFLDKTGQHVQRLAPHLRHLAKSLTFLRSRSLVFLVNLRGNTAKHTLINTTSQGIQFGFHRCFIKKP